MNILLINQVFVAPSEPGHTRHYELGRYMQQYGHKLTIVASDMNYLTGKPIEGNEGFINEHYFDGVRVLRTYVIRAIHRNFIWRVLSFISFMVTSVIAAMRVRDIDVVMGTSPPIFQALSAWFVAFLRRKPFLLEIRDLWPEFAIDMGVLRNGVLIRLARWLESFLYARATKILVNSPAYRDYMIEHGVPAEKVVFIPYGADVNMFKPDASGDMLQADLGLEDQFVVAYTGALGTANDIYTVLDAAEQLKPYPDIMIALFGDGKERPRLEEETKKRVLNNVHFAGTYNKSEMPTVLAAADVCMAILQNIPMFRTTYPNKVFDYMASGRATILAIDGVIRDVMTDADGGIVVEPGNPTALAEAIVSLWRDPERRDAMGQNARQYVVKHFNREDKMRETVELFESLNSNAAN